MDMQCHLTMDSIISYNGSVYYGMQLTMRPSVADISSLQTMIHLHGHNPSAWAIKDVIAKIPGVLTSGTRCDYTNGTPYTLPHNVTYLAMRDYPVKTDVTPYDALLDLPVSPYIWYVSTLPDIQDVYPDLLSAATLAAAAQDPVITPSTWQLAQYVVASRYNNYPFWTRVRWLWAAILYATCVDVPDTHYLLHPNSMSVLETIDGNGPLYLHTGHAYRIECCIDTWQGQPVQYETYGPNGYYVTFWGQRAQDPLWHINPTWIGIPSRPYRGRGRTGGGGATGHWGMSLLGDYDDRLIRGAGVLTYNDYTAITYDSKERVQ